MPSAAIERCRCVLAGPGRDALFRLFIVSWSSTTDDDLDEDEDEPLALAAAAPGCPTEAEEDDVEWPK